MDWNNKLWTGKGRNYVHAFFLSLWALQVESRVLTLDSSTKVLIDKLFLKEKGTYWWNYCRGRKYHWTMVVCLPFCWQTLLSVLYRTYDLEWERFFWTSSEPLMFFLAPVNLNWITLYLTPFCSERQTIKFVLNESMQNCRSWFVCHSDFIISIVSTYFLFIQAKSVFSSWKVLQTNKWNHSKFKMYYIILHNMQYMVLAPCKIKNRF